MKNDMKDTVIVSKTTLIEWVRLVIRISDATAQDLDRSKQASELENDMLALVESREFDQQGALRGIKTTETSGLTIYF